jgi:hypothetical protein
MRPLRGDAGQRAANPYLRRLAVKVFVAGFRVVAGGADKGTPEKVPASRRRVPQIRRCGAGGAARNAAAIFVAVGTACA